LERVRHRFTLLFDDLKALEYDDKLAEQLQLWSLDERRNCDGLIDMFKMVRVISNVPLQSFFKLADGNCTRDHRWKLVKEHSKNQAIIIIIIIGHQHKACRQLKIKQEMTAVGD